MVAFSGGADSAFLLAAAVRALGADNVAAATAYSDSLPASERGPAQDFAESLGVEVLTPETHGDGARGLPRQRRRPLRFCKAELLDVLGPLAAEHGYDAVATGTNADDARAGFRPGIVAAAERGAVTPLIDAGLTKDADPGGLPGVGPADVGQAGGRLPELADRLRHRDHPGPPRPGRARRGGAPGRPHRGRPRRRATFGSATSATRARVEVDRELVEAAAEHLDVRPRGRFRGGRGRPARLPLRAR